MHIQLHDLENRLTANFQNHEDKIVGNYASLRKWVGGIEKDYLKPLLSKLDTLDKLGDLGFNKILEDKLNTPKIENPLNLNIKSEVKEINNTEQAQINPENKDGKFKDLYAKYDKQKQALFKIFNTSKIETGGMMSKERIIVNLSAEEWDELKKLI